MGIFPKYKSPTEAIEDIIRVVPELYQQFKTGHSYSDFNSLDVVRCTYIKGFLQVKEVTKDKILVNTIPYNENNPIEWVSPEFLNKADVDKNTLELLYAKKD